MTLPTNSFSWIGKTINHADVSVLPQAVDTLLESTLDKRHYQIGPLPVLLMQVRDVVVVQDILACSKQQHGLPSAVLHPGEEICTNTVIARNKIAVAGVLLGQTGSVDLRLVAVQSISLLCYG